MYTIVCLPLVAKAHGIRAPASSSMHSGKLAAAVTTLAHTSTCSFAGPETKALRSEVYHTQNLLLGRSTNSSRPGKNISRPRGPRLSPVTQVTLVQTCTESVATSFQHACKQLTLHLNSRQSNRAETSRIHIVVGLNQHHHWCATTIPDVRQFDPPRALGVLRERGALRLIAQSKPAIAEHHRSSPSSFRVAET